ncbi:MAG: hypothetical protein VX546_14220 [Myxococcota bacterium]|nr:hypothetical protein [Myxococcota bacterium]
MKRTTAMSLAVLILGTLGIASAENLKTTRNVTKVVAEPTLEVASPATFVAPEAAVDAGEAGPEPRAAEPHRCQKTCPLSDWGVHLPPNRGQTQVRVGGTTRGGSPAL